MSELFPREEVDEKVEGRVEYGQESVGEDDKDVAPEGRPALVYCVQLKHLVQVESHPWDTAAVRVEPIKLLEKLRAKYKSDALVQHNFCVLNR